MNSSYKVIVAHPDDEILFFSSVLKNAIQTIFCFGPSENKNLTIGRQKLKAQLPLNNVLFLDLLESNVLNSANWKKPKKNNEGIAVSNNFYSYQENYKNLKVQLSKVIGYGETIFTHNPWGEYGHEEHVQVFRVIMSLANDLNLKVFVSCYVSNKSYLFMTMEQHLLSDEVHTGKPDTNLISIFKNIYQSNLCWTWHEEYCWPKFELFFKINKDVDYLKFKTSRMGTLPLSMLSGNYKTNVLKQIVGKILPTNIKNLIKPLMRFA